MAVELNPNKPLKPKASAVWLIENTTLSFDQIAEYTGLHAIEVQALADEEVGKGIIGEDPIKSGELSQEEIQRCEQDGVSFLQTTLNQIPMSAAIGAEQSQKGVDVHLVCLCVCVDVCVCLCVCLEQTHAI